MELTGNLSDVRAGSTVSDVQATLASRGLQLGRAWPRGDDHLLLEVLQGSVSLAGQWFSTEARAAVVARRTDGAERLGRVVLQPGGADRKLAGLSGLVRRPGAVLVAHRPERRAVVRLTAADGSTEVRAYAKVVRPEALPDLTRTARLAAGLPVRTPAVLGTDPGLSAAITAPLPGRTLHDLLVTPDGVNACRRAGQALAAVHRTSPPSGLPRHDAGAEQTVVRRWQRLAAAHGLCPAPSLGPSLAGQRPVDPRVPDDGLALVHRDFHDKQVVVDDDGSIGLLDFDLMALGAPMMDVANFLVHLDLRARQGLVPDSAPLRAAVLDGYRPRAPQLTSLPYYERTTWDRLVAVYAFRPAGTTS